jgi:uncharacterized protein
MIPTWTYVKAPDGIYTNLFIGGSVRIEGVAGTEVEMVQKTDYPWSGGVSLTVNPKEAKTFTVYVRVPDRKTSELYSATPEVRGLKSLAVNGKPLRPKIEKGYAVLTRKWRAGDRIDFVLPLEPQRITADEKIAADRGRVALRYGPLIYSVERADQPDLGQPLGAAPLRAEWRGDLLEGVVTLVGEWADGTPLLAIPNYARLNRGGQVAENPAAAGVNYAPGASTGTPAASPVPAAKPAERRRPAGPESLVWIKAQP